MSGWLRLWLVISLAASGAVFAYGLLYHPDPGPRRFSDEYLQTALGQMEQSTCQVLRGCQSSQDCPQVERLNLSSRQDFLDACGAYFGLVIVGRPLSMDPMPVGRSQFIEAAAMYRAQHERSVRDFRLWVLQIPAGLFAALWLVFLVGMGITRWIRAGFRRDRAGSAQA